MFGIIDNWVILTGLIVRGSTRRYRHDLNQLVKFSGSGSWSGLARRKRRGTPDVHLLRDSCTAFTRLCRRKASFKVTTYPRIVEIQRTMSAADQDRIIGVPEGGRRAIASKAVSTGVKPIRDLEFSLILIVGKVIQC